MKALLVLSDNIYLTPYLKFYTGVLEEAGYQYKILYWDKNGNEAFNEDSCIRFSNSAKDKVGKVMGYLKFRKYVLETIKNGDFDLIIPLHSIVLICLYNTLKNRYSGRFILDIRDYSYEKFPPYRKIERDLVKKSIMNIISSKGYIHFLPKAEYSIVHNIPRVDCSQYRQTVNSSGIMNLSFIGLIRFMDQNKKIIRFFHGDDRFHLSFVGTNAEKLQEYCNHIGADNVSLIGTFDSSKTLDFYKDADAILNLYGNHTPMLDYALSNKLYFSASLYKPILVCEDTYMEKVSQKYQLGFTLRMKDEKERDDLYSYLTSLNRVVFIKKCDEFMEMAIQE
jgi:hypothetical protein